jgi:hypothetical protein
MNSQQSLATAKLKSPRSKKEFAASKIATVAVVIAWLFIILACQLLDRDWEAAPLMMRTLKRACFGLQAISPLQWCVLRKPSGPNGHCASRRNIKERVRDMGETAEPLDALDRL